MSGLWKTTNRTPTRQRPATSNLAWAVARPANCPVARVIPSKHSKPVIQSMMLALHRHVKSCRRPTVCWTPSDSNKRRHFVGVVVEHVADLLRQIGGIAFCIAEWFPLHADIGRREEPSVVWRQMQAAGQRQDFSSLAPLLRLLTTYAESDPQAYAQGRNRLLRLACQVHCQSGNAQGGEVATGSAEPGRNANKGCSKMKP